MTTPPISEQPTKRLRLNKHFKARTLTYTNCPPTSRWYSTQETDMNTGFTTYLKEPLQGWTSYRDTYDFKIWRKANKEKGWVAIFGPHKLDREWVQHAPQIPYNDTFLFDMGPHYLSLFLDIDDSQVIPADRTRYMPSPFYLALLADELQPLRPMVKKPLVFTKTDRLNRHGYRIWTFNGVELNGPEHWDRMALCNEGQVAESASEQENRLYEWLQHTEGHTLLIKDVPTQEQSIHYYMGQEVRDQLSGLATLYLTDHLTNMLVEQVALGVMSNFATQFKAFTTDSKVVARNETYKRCYIDAPLVRNLFASKRLRLLRRIEPSSPFVTRIK